MPASWEVTTWVLVTFFTLFLLIGYLVARFIKTSVGVVILVIINLIFSLIAFVGTSAVRCVDYCYSSELDVILRCVFLFIFIFVSNMCGVALARYLRT